MGSSHEPPPGWDSGDALDVRAEALDVISDALQWRLVAQRWHAIEEVLAAMDAALAANDLQALAAATADLELAGPLRITPDRVHPRRSSAATSPRPARIAW